MLHSLTYCIIDETDPHDDFECEGQVVHTFFAASRRFDKGRSLSLIRPKADVVKKLVRSEQKLFNIFHIAAHGEYSPRSKSQLDYAVLTRKIGKRYVEFFRPEFVVREQLQADVFVSTACEGFNDYAVETMRGYEGICNYIAPTGGTNIGDTLVFSVMFYNHLLDQVAKSQKAIKDDEVVRAFKATNQAYKSYGGEGNFKLYNRAKNHCFE